MHTLLIVNPTSGQGKAAREKRRLLDLVSNMPHIHAEITTGPCDALDMAREAVERHYDRIIAAGGDGTINQIINGISGAEIELGIIPLGTGNVLAHDLGIPANSIDQALGIIEAGNTRSVDVACAGGRRFVLMAGLASMRL